MYCPACGVKAGEEAKKCPHCGKRYWAAVVDLVFDGVGAAGVAGRGRVACFRAAEQADFHADSSLSG